MAGIETIKSGLSLKNDYRVYASEILGSGVAGDNISNVTLISGSYAVEDRDVSGLTTEQVVFLEAGGEKLARPNYSGANDIYLGLQIGAGTSFEDTFEQEVNELRVEGALLDKSVFSSNISIAFTTPNKFKKNISEMIFQNTESNGVVGIANNPVNSGKRYLVSVVHLLTDGSKAVTQLFRCGLTAATGDLDGYKAYTITASGEVEPVQSEEFSLGMRVWA